MRNTMPTAYTAVPIAVISCSRHVPGITGHVGPEYSGLHRSASSDLGRVDVRPIGEGDYDELPELDEAMLARAVLRSGGRSARRLGKNVLVNARLAQGV